MSEAPGSATIEVSGLRSGYHGVTVLKGLDFSLGKEVFAVLGANGAGKTTLLATLARLLPLMGGYHPLRGRGRLPSPALRDRGAGHRLRARRSRGYSPTSPSSRTCGSAA